MESTLYWKTKVFNFIHIFLLNVLIYLVYFSENNVAGCPRLVKGQLLELLSPIAEHHGNSFLTAFSIVWKERRSRATVLSPSVRSYTFLFFFN